MDDKPLLMKFANPSYAIKKLRLTFQPQIFLREFVQNSIEAIQRTPNKTGDITIDWCEQTPEENKSKKVYKLRITDNGVGMDEDKLLDMQNLFAPKDKNIYENFGIGAKVTGLLRSPEGVSYISWVDGVGRRLLLNMKNDIPGIEAQVSFANGEPENITIGEGFDQEVYAPKLGLVPHVQEHGTSVVLQGNNDLDSTFFNPIKGSKDKISWIPKYLNNRYFTFPNNIYVRVKRKDDGHKRIIYGQLHYLKTTAKKSGTVNLSFGPEKKYDATVHWWIIKEPKDLILKDKKTHAGHYPKLNGTAILFQNELYENHSAKNWHRMKDFGIKIDHQYIRLIVEPKAGQKFEPDISRDKLCCLYDKDPTRMPWKEWGEEFEKNMPDAIKKHMDEKLKDLSGASSEEITLKALNDLEKINKIIQKNTFMEHKNGSVLDNVEEGELFPHGPYIPGSINPRPNPIEPDPNTPNLFNPIIVPGKKKLKGIKIKPKKPTIIFKWYSEEVEMLENKLANYDDKANFIHANKSFFQHAENIDRLIDAQKTLRVLDTPELIAKEYFNCVQYKLIMACGFAQNYKRKKEFIGDKYMQMISSEALLTTIVPDDTMIQFIFSQVKEAKNKPKKYKKQETKQVDYTPHIEPIEQRV
jgi:hypothetical protein